MKPVFEHVVLLFDEHTDALVNVEFALRDLALPKMGTMSQQCVLIFDTYDKRSVFGEEMRFVDQDVVVEIANFMKRIGFESFSYT